MKTQGQFDVADMKTDRIWRFRWVCRNDVGGYAPHYNFYVWDGVCGCWRLRAFWAGRQHKRSATNPPKRCPDRQLWAVMWLYGDSDFVDELEF